MPPQQAFVGPGEAVGGGRLDAQVLKPAVDMQRIEKMLHEITKLSHTTPTRETWPVRSGKPPAGNPNSILWASKTLKL